MLSRVSAPLRLLKRRLTLRFLDREEARFERGLVPGTGGVVAATDLTVRSGDASEGHAYVAEHPRVIALWMRTISDRASFTLVDLGSGKGRVLVAGARGGFRKVVGVEHAQELHEAAMLNVEGLLTRSSQPIQLVLGDAGGYEYPHEPLVVHLNNPFGEQTMGRVIEKLTSSYEAQPRPIIVVYQQAQVEDDPTRNVDLLGAVPFLRPRPIHRSMLDRSILKSWRVDVFVSPEAATMP
jgi:predicted RNA methylase